MYNCVKLDQFKFQLDVLLIRKLIQRNISKRTMVDDYRSYVCNYARVILLTRVFDIVLWVGVIDLYHSHLEIKESRRNIIWSLNWKHERRSRKHANNKYTISKWILSHQTLNKRQKEQLSKIWNRNEKCLYCFDNYCSCKGHDFIYHRHNFKLA